MKILGISGTPRKGGNSEILIDAAPVPFIDAYAGYSQDAL